jgi:hypothetical protein
MIIRQQTHLDVIPLIKILLTVTQLVLCALMSSRAISKDRMRKYVQGIQNSVLEGNPQKNKGSGARGITKKNIS